MTLKKIIDGLKFTVDMFLFDPTTGETYTEPRSDMDKITIDACKGAIELLEQTRWIPVSERLPEMYEEIGILKKYVSMKSDEVIVTIRDNKNGSVVTHSKCYLWDGKWHGDIFDWLKASKVDYEVIAWMPLPEPYKAESEGEE